MFRGIDFYSDTMTRPTAAMKRAMCDAETGDEQKGEDPTTRRLEERVAEMLGTTAAMFFPSSTMSNQIALKAFSRPGDELIAASACHLFFAEAGGPAVHSGLMSRPIATPNGVFTGADLQRDFSPYAGPNFPRPRIVSIENTTNTGGGIAWPLEAIDSVAKVGRELGLHRHVDGSRLFNAAVKLGVPPRRLVEGYDTVTICFSKGLGCPTGAVLAYPKEAYAEIRRLKQMFGGAMRQSGMLAAAALHALDHHVDRLQDDHRNAQMLAEGLCELHPLLRVEKPVGAVTNMVYFEWGGDPADFVARTEARGVRFSQMGNRRFRAVTHLDVTESQVREAISILKEVL